MFVNALVSAIEEAKWTLGMCKDKDSIVEAVVAHVPCRQGAVQVRKFLEALRDPESGRLPEQLKGARNVFLGSPMPKFDACLDQLFIEGLEELARNEGLHWEFAFTRRCQCRKSFKDFPRFSSCWII